ncbi:zinc transport system substrate-binding protein [Dysgonomonas hofstadii]|uniref:Zinc transport system substrate-binding protein n=1 Tax=Dysgonomonas hofstadii TaxID=637886 RepID=A0A840CQE8_9BACT|nr:zinc ABC transporter substrate-binding protein [Dysgonomonas hofstadii]MBB4035834.1 zinc transport system substrate-binding protein [Dysgonomonas hofstadii]
MNYRFIIVVLSLIFLSIGCTPPKEKPKTLTVTIEPQKYFLEAIVGHHYKVECIVPGGANPESADFTPSQLMNLDKSVAYFKIGYLGIENTLIEKVTKTNDKIKVINCSEGIELVGEPCDQESHDGHNHGHAGGDPHIWSSVTSAKKMAENMYRAILELDAENEADYTANYNKLVVDINKTDSIIRSYLDKAPSKAFIIYHPALSYFAKEYGLTQHSIEHEGKNPSPSQLKALIDTAKTENVKVVFIQREFDIKNAETIAEAIQGKTVPLNLLSYYWDEEMIKVAKALAQKYE